MHKTGCWKRRRTRSQSQSLGFTLAETMLVVAILTILAGVGFIAVLRWRAILRQLELDETAKELYMAAQNHLYYAESQGLLEEKKEDGTYKYDRGHFYENETNGSTKVYYFIYGSGSGYDNPDAEDSNVLGLMLPFGSIDVRTSGSYLIRYEPDTASVLDVFYTDGKEGVLPSGEGGYVYITDPDNTDPDNGFSGDDKKEARRSVNLVVASGTKKGIIGYYEGAAGDEVIKLKAPIVKIDNGDTLSVTVTDPMPAGVTTGKSVNDKRIESKKKGTESINLKFRLMVEGKTSEAKAYTIITTEVNAAKTAGGTPATIVLDDITTANGSFKAIGATGSKFTLLGDKEFTPGEDIVIYAWVWSDGYCEAAKSSAAVTNSIFASANEGMTEVSISNCRHLANLSGDVSGFNPGTTNVVKATQTTNLSWKAFRKSFSSTPSVWYTFDSVGGSKTDKTEPVGGTSNPIGTFRPVHPSYKLEYDGKGFRISDVVVSFDGPTGVFATLSSGSMIHDVEVVNASINSTGKLIDKDEHELKSAAGALVGSFDGDSIENVLVRTTLTANAIAGNAVSSSGNTGGLVGTLSSGTISKCAAAVRVSSNGGATGGLVGFAASGSQIENSYSGGHTTNGSYNTESGSVADVTSTSTSGAAGGLVGNTAATISGCYSTCSVRGATEGGFAGSISGGSVSNTYATGWVDPSASETPGAFAGSSSITSGDSNYYYEIINSVINTVSGKAVSEPMQAIGDDDSNTAATPFDVDTGTFKNVYTGGEKNSTGKDSALAIPYDTTLAKLYVNGGKTHYAFSSIEQLTKSTLDSGTFVKRHYGDWPAREILVINTK